METSTNTEVEAGDEEYEADDEWTRRSKISQIRKSMKHKKWGPPRRPTETEDSGRWLRHLYDFASDSLKTIFTAIALAVMNANATSTNLVA